ncbi:MAG: 50S ribosomal protein L30 [Sulfolobales archaeon]|jgi:large subunit ribosomal protein L30
MALLLIIRLRGRSGAPPDVEHTLQLLRLTRKFHAVIYPDSESVKGMLEVVKDWVTWGEVDPKVLKELIIRRGRLVGDKPITDEDLKNIFNVSTFDELVEALMNGKILWHKEPRVTPIFRLRPPKGGFKRSIKRPYKASGELGYRGSEINELVKRMM